LLLLFICARQLPAAKTVKAIIVHRSWPIGLDTTKGNAKNVLYDDVQIIYKYNDYVLYKLTGIQDFVTGDFLPNSEPYFLYKNDYSAGKYFDSVSARPVNKPVDSMVKQYQIITLGLVDTAKGGVLVKDIANKQTRILHYYYNPPIKTEKSIDSLYLYFDTSQNDVEYSFSKEMDSVYKMKLCKVSYIYNPRYSPSKKISFPRLEYMFDFRKGEIKNQDSMKNIIQHFIDKK